MRQSKSNGLRELALLCAPILIVAAGAIYVTSARARAIERKTGPLRTVVENVSSSKANPLQAWQGYDWQVTVNYRIDGNPQWPEGLAPNNYWLPNLNWKGKAPVQIGSQARGEREMQMTLLVKTRDFPASTQKFAGNLSASDTAWAGTDHWEQRNSKLTSLELEIPAGVNRANEVDQNAPNVFWVKTTPKTVPVTGIEIAARVRAPRWRDHGGNKWICRDVRITDREGKAIIASGNLGLGNRRFLTDGSSIFFAFIPISQLPKTHGKLYYEAWLSCENSWPVKVSCPL